MDESREKEMSEDDASLREELLRLVRVLTITRSEEDESFGECVKRLGESIETSTSSMTAVPKPLKYLMNSYDELKNAYERIKSRRRLVGANGTEGLAAPMLENFADILSVLSLVGGVAGSAGSRDCLKYRLEGTGRMPGNWGHEYVRRLEADIVDEYLAAPIDREQRVKEKLMPLVESIVGFDVEHNAEIQACDLCLEIDQLETIDRHLDETNFSRISNYLENCAIYSEETERERILHRVAENCVKFGEYSRAMTIGLELDDSALMKDCLEACPDAVTRKQLAFILARQKRQYPEPSTFRGKDDDDEPARRDIETILGGSMVNLHYRMLARELDILEPKSPEEICKSRWLPPVQLTGLPVQRHDSARANLAASFVSAFVHAGFGLDKLITNSSEGSWVYRNKDHGMLSATAALGLIHMWDVDGGLVPIDKYLYASDDNVKSGALLAIGIVNCGVRNECDPALALLSDYVSAAGTSQTLRIGAILGLGIAYAGTRRPDVTELLIRALSDRDDNLEVASLCAVSLGLINPGTENAEISTAILDKLLQLSATDLANTYARFLPLALGMIYMGRRDAIDTVSTALEVLPEPHKLAAQTMLQVCSYAGTGDVLVVQELLHLCSEATSEASEDRSNERIPPAASSAGGGESTARPTFDRANNHYREIGSARAIACLGVSVVSLGQAAGENARILGQLGRYGCSSLRRAVPVATALSSLSNPEGSLVDVLNRYSHDGDPEVAHSAILSLGLVGAGTNNARLATMLRHLAAYHSKDPAILFLVRISEGLVHLGKGTLTICPLRYDGRIIDHASLAALMVVLVASLDCKNLILARSHYLLYCLAVAMEPRWLVTLDENLQALPVSVRVGEAVDVVGKVGKPKVIKAGHVHTTPLLLGAGERAELVDERYEPLSGVLEGFVILCEKTSEASTRRRQRR